MDEMKLSPGVEYLYGEQTKRLDQADRTIAVLLERIAVLDRYRSHVEDILTTKQKEALAKALA